MKEKENRSQLVPKSVNPCFEEKILHIATYLCIQTLALISQMLFFLSIGLFFLQISRSIGDVYLKKAEFNREPLYAKFRLREPFKKPILSSEPSITVHELQPHDQFVIFASDGLWEHLSNQEAVDIVQNHPRSVSLFILLLSFILSLFNLLLTIACTQGFLRHKGTTNIQQGLVIHSTTHSNAAKLL